MSTPYREPGLVTSGTTRAWPLPAPGGSKNTSGRVLVVGGHAGMPGGILLAAEAAFRAGAGKVQVATAEPVATALAVALPEAFVVGLPVDASGDLTAAGADQVVDLAQDADAVLLGPGFMDPQAAAGFAAATLPRLESALCLDALALAHLTGNLDALGELAARTVLTPNSQELGKTLDRELPGDLTSEEGLRALVEATVELSRDTGAVVASGAESTVVAAPDGRSWLDHAGGSGLAVSGSGDVKAGILVGLLARGLVPEQAAVWAVHVHGRCGERLASTVAPRGFLAREILPLVPGVLVELGA